MPDTATRPIYQSAKNRADEARIARAYADAQMADQAKIGWDRNKEYSCVDRLILRDGHVVCLVEIKRRNYEFGKYASGFGISRRKIEDLRTLVRLMCIPVLLLIEFSDGKLFTLDVKSPYRLDPKFGRHDRGDEADLEEGALFRWDLFEEVNW